MQEVWKSVKGYDDRFMISSEGRLANSQTGKILSQTLSSGYLSHSTRIGGRKGKAFNLRIHRLVAEAFLEPPSDELICRMEKTVYGVVLVNHKDGNKKNNRTENLEWCDHSQNMKHAMENNLMNFPVGCNNKNSYFSDKNMVDEIRRIHIDTGISRRSIAKLYGCSRHTIDRIINKIGYVSYTV